MHWIDWTILIGYILYIVWHGLKLTKKANELEGYFVAGRSLFLRFRIRATVSCAQSRIGRTRRSSSTATPAPQSSGSRTSDLTSQT